MVEIKQRIEELESLLPVARSISFSDAEKRAGEFLLGMAQITNWRHLFNEDKIRLITNQTAVYAELMAKGTAKTMTENKLYVEASPEYTKAREELERIDNDLSYLKAYYDIFMSAHVFYRQMARGENV